MITDCITFHSGLDILEIRFNALVPFVDRFIIVESPYNMVGNRKPLYFYENKDRFSDFNITHLVVDDHEKHMGGWTPYYHQIDYMMKELNDVDGDDIILLSDFDEIPDLRNYDGEEGAFRQKLYYYYLNVYSGTRNWKGTVATRRENLKSLSEVRQKRNQIGGLRKLGGWHFSYVCSVDEIITKIESFCHQELNRDDVKGKIAENRRNLVDPFNRSEAKFRVEMPDGPPYLLENVEKYNHIIYAGA